MPVTQTGVAGAAISPNSRMLYVASPFQIDQLDLAATDILASRITVATLDTTTFSCSGPGSYYGFFLGQLATNGKIYFSTPYLSTDALHIINYPDSIGLACQVIQHGLSDIGANYMVPNHPNYYLPALTMPCDSILSGFEEGDIGQNTVILSPNPATTTIDLRFSLPLAANTMLTIYNSLGQQIEKQTLAEGIQRYTYNVASWANGIYFYRIVTGEQMLAGKWLIKK